MDFWGRLRESIKENGLTQESVARKIKVPIGTLKNWLTRQTYPDALKIVEISKLLNTTVEYLVGGSDHGNLNNDEIGLIKNYRKLSKCDQDHISFTAEAWARRFGKLQ
jgi:transcriptional regulator with XRE-family HTH domain